METRPEPCSASSVRIRYPDVKVVVVVGKRLDHVLGPAQAHVRPDEHESGAGSNEQVNQILGQRAIHLRRDGRRARETVDARIVDVDVAPVLMCRVADRPAAPTEIAAARPAEVTHEHWQGPRVCGQIVPGNPEHHPDEGIRAESPPRAVGGAAQHRVPGGEVAPPRRKEHTPHKRPGGRQPERTRRPPANRLVSRSPPRPPVKPAGLGPSGLLDQRTHGLRSVVPCAASATHRDVEGHEYGAQNHEQRQQNPKLAQPKTDMPFEEHRTRLSTGANPQMNRALRFAYGQLQARGHPPQRYNRGAADSASRVEHGAAPRLLPVRVPAHPAVAPNGPRLDDGVTTFLVRREVGSCLARPLPISTAPWPGRRACGPLRSTRRRGLVSGLLLSGPDVGEGGADEAIRDA